MRFINTIGSWLARIFPTFRKKRSISYVVDISPAPANSKIGKPEKPKIEQDTSWGVVNSLPKLLKDLPDYFKVMKAMRKEWLSDYDYFSQVGGQVVDGDCFGEAFDLPTVWKKGYRPAAGMVYIRPYDAPDRLFVAAITFRKFKWSEGIELPKKGETIYIMNIYYYDKEKSVLKKGITSLQFVLAASNDSVRVLRSLHDNGHWRIPFYCKYLGTSDGSAAVSYEEGKSRVLKVFHFAIGVYIYSGDGILTSCLDPETGIWASFNIPMTRAPYFFRERVKVAAESGRTAPIFHSVKPHERIIGETKINVRFHFRGLREFVWHGFKVKISVAGWHHSDLRDFSASAVDVPIGERKKRGWLYDREVAAKFRHHIMNANRSRNGLGRRGLH